MASPFEICERAWVLWNISLVRNLDSEVISLCQPHLEALFKSWNASKGVGFTHGHSVPDGDDTSLTFDVLQRFGYELDWTLLRDFEEDNWFRCYPMETTSSISTNVHFLGALLHAGLDKKHPLIQKIFKYLESNRINNSFWYDKWHVSPIYTTAHAIIACSGIYNQLVARSVEWLIEQQNADGSWGFFIPTAEETSYALQALSIWHRDGYEKIDKVILIRGLRWLEEHSTPPYPLLWIAKSLNYSEWIIHSEIISAKALVAEVI
jgi:halimadienyl-diphosphate synthase